jgi:Xaa-Pro aminopeptidase
MFDLSAIQHAIRDFGLDGWLLYDFRGINPLARRVLGFAEGALLSRRWMYWIPAIGQPQKLVHRIESGALDHLPGEKTVYSAWDEFEWGVASLLRGAGRVAMEYSPRNGIPYISRVDAGTIELVRSYGVEVESSGDLVQQFEATWTEAQWEMHLEAGRHTDSAYDRAWSYIAERVRRDGSVRETDVQRVILDHFRQHGLVTDHPPNVSVNEHSGDPHYEPKAGHDAVIRAGDFVLIDLWAKVNHPDGVYSDLTRVAFVGDVVPSKYEQIFQIVARARDAAIDLVRQRMASGEALRGWEVDHAARSVIQDAGYGEYFVHRTGHNIGRETHGNGANMDGLETRETRLVLPRTCFSIEPGIYFPEFGVRSEVNVFIDDARRVHVTAGDLQRHVLPLFAAGATENTFRT